MAITAWEVPAVPQQCQSHIAQGVSSLSAHLSPVSLVSPKQVEREDSAPNRTASGSRQDEGRLVGYDVRAATPHHRKEGKEMLNGGVAPLGA